MRFGSFHLFPLWRNFGQKLKWSKWQISFVFNSEKLWSYKMWVKLTEPKIYDRDFTTGHFLKPINMFKLDLKLQTVINPSTIFGIFLQLDCPLWWRVWLDPKTFLTIACILEMMMSLLKFSACSTNHASNQYWITNYKEKSDNFHIQLKLNVQCSKLTLRGFTRELQAACLKWSWDGFLEMIMYSKKLQSHGNYRLDFFYLLPLPKQKCKLFVLKSQHLFKY